MAESSKSDAKVRALQERGVLNPEPEGVMDERFRTGGGL